MTIKIEKTDVIELLDDNQLYFVVDTKDIDNGYMVVEDMHRQKWNIEVSRVVNTWRHVQD